MSYKGPENKCAPLMQQLARMANMEFAKVRRMVLVLDVSNIPTLYTEGFLPPVEEELVPAKLEVHEDVPVVIDTTTMQNKEWRSAIPKPG